MTQKVAWFVIILSRALLYIVYIYTHIYVYLYKVVLIYIFFSHLTLASHRKASKMILILLTNKSTLKKARYSATVHGTHRCGGGSGLGGEQGEVSRGGWVLDALRALFFLSHSNGAGGALWPSPLQGMDPAFETENKLPRATS